jgi:metabotropic glutamate receptor 6/7/8
MEPVKALIKACIKSATRQLMCLGALVLVDVLLAVCWISTDPPHLNMTFTQDGYIFLSCKNFNSKPGLALMMCMLIYLIVQALVCIYYAFRARKLPGNFNEAKYIAFSMYIILLSWIAYFPVGYALQGWYVAVVSCATSLVSGYGVLGCIFVPKLYMILLHPEKNTTTSVRAELQVFTRVDTFSKPMISDNSSC